MCIRDRSASGRSRFAALQCGTIFRLTSHQCHHSWLSDSASSRSCSLSLIQTFISDSHSLLLSLHLRGSSDNWHLSHTKNHDNDDDIHRQQLLWVQQVWHGLKSSACFLVWYRTTCWASCIINHAKTHPTSSATTDLSCRRLSPSCYDKFHCRIW